MRQPVDSDGLRRKPQNMRDSLCRSRVDDRCWYYEQRGGIWVGMSGDYITLDGWIPIAQLRAYLRRHDGAETEKTDVDGG